MLDYDLHLLCDVVRVKPDPVHQPFHGSAAFDFSILQFLTPVGQLKRQLVRRVVLQYIQDETFFDCLTHRIHMEWFRQIGRSSGLRRIRKEAKQLQRLRLGGRGEGDVSDASISSTRIHLSRENVFRANRPTVFEFLLFFGGEDHL